MIKGQIVILTKDDKTDKYFDYLCDSIKEIKIKSKAMRRIRTNRYNIEINPYNNIRGHCPEIIYIEQEYLDILKSNPELYQAYEYIKYKASNFSHNRDPIRIIDNFKNIDLKEMQDGQYTISNIKVIESNDAIRSKRASIIYFYEDFEFEEDK